MGTFSRLFIALAISMAGLYPAHAISLFGAYATGADLDPFDLSLQDGGSGSSEASVDSSTANAFSNTFAADARFVTGSYLPILRARGDGRAATSADDRTNAEASAYEFFTSSVNQTIDLRITHDSTVFALDSSPNFSSTPRGSSVLDVYVFLDPYLQTSSAGCDNDERMNFGVYLCGKTEATSSRNGLDWSNLGNLTSRDGNNTRTLRDTLSFDVNAGQTFAIYAELRAGGFGGFGDAFSTATLEYLALSPDSNIGAISPKPDPSTGQIANIVPFPSPSQVPLPAAAWLFGTALVGVIGFSRRKGRYQG